MSDTSGARPKSGTVLGILNIIFGGSGILGGFISIGIFSFINNLFRSLVYELPSDFFWVMQTLGSFFTSLSIITAVQLVANALGLASGITLLKDRRSAILLSNLYAGLSIAIAIAGYFISINLVRGLFGNQELLSYMTAEDKFMLNVIKGLIPGVAGIVGVLFSCAYPVVLLILLNKQNVRTFYSGKA